MERKRVWMKRKGREVARAVADAERKDSAATLEDEEGEVHFEGVWG